MYTFDQCYNNVPYELLIRARTQVQFDRAIFAISSHIAATVLSAQVSEKLAPVIRKTIANITLKDESEASRGLSATSIVAALHALADFDDYCGTPWRWWWPRPPRRPEPPEPWPIDWREFGYFDIVALKTINSLASLIKGEVGQEVVNVSQSLIEAAV